MPKQKPAVYDWFHRADADVDLETTLAQAMTFEASIRRRQWDQVDAKHFLEVVADLAKLSDANYQGRSTKARAAIERIANAVKFRPGMNRRSPKANQVERLVAELVASDAVRMYRFFREADERTKRRITKAGVETELQRRERAWLLAIDLFYRELKMRSNDLDGFSKPAPEDFDEFRPVMICKDENAVRRAFRATARTRMLIRPRRRTVEISRPN